MSYGWAAHAQFWLDFLVYLMSLLVFAWCWLLNTGFPWTRKYRCKITIVFDTLGTLWCGVVSSGVQPLLNWGSPKFTFFQFLFLMTWYQHAGFRHQPFSAELNAVASEVSAEPHSILNAVLIVCNDYLEAYWKECMLKISTNAHFETTGPDNMEKQDPFPECFIITHCHVVCKKALLLPKSYQIC